MSTPAPAPNGTTPRASTPIRSSARAPRRLVLLEDGNDSAVARVLAEQQGADVSGKRLHADLQRLAAEHSGQCVAAEWRGPLGWVRFLWCRL
jgi:hypothetical protein